MKLRMLLVVAIATIFLGFTGCGSTSANGEVPLPQLEEPQKGEDIAVITTNHGVIKMRMFPEQAPKAVENFTTLATEGYYDGIIFHRVIDGFMIQGGDPTGTGMGGESIYGAPFEHEISPNLHHINGAVAMANSGKDTNGSQFYIVENDQLDENSTAVLNKMKENQDFELGKNEAGDTVLVKDLFPTAIIDKYLAEGGALMLDTGIITNGMTTQGKLGPGYTVFGQVTEGMDVVHEIAEVATDESDKPVEDVVIEKVEIVPYE